MEREKRPLTPGEKLRTVEMMWFSARALKRAALKKQHPEWTEEQLRQEVRRIFLLAR